MRDQSLPDIPLPSGWDKNVKSAVLHLISLVYHAIAAARGWAANSINARARLSSGNDHLKQETQLLREELRIKDARMAKINPRRRPYYPPVERRATFELKAARGQSSHHVAAVADVDGRDRYTADSYRRIIALAGTRRQIRLTAARASSINAIIRDFGDETHVHGLGQACRNGFWVTAQLSRIPGHKWWSAAVERVEA